MKKAVLPYKGNIGIAIFLGGVLKQMPDRFDPIGIDISIRSCRDPAWLFCSPTSHHQPPTFRHGTSNSEVVEGGQGGWMGDGGDEGGEVVEVGAGRWGLGGGGWEVGRWEVGKA